MQYALLQTGSINKSLLTLGAVIRALGVSSSMVAASSTTPPVQERVHRLSESSNTPMKDGEKVGPSILVDALKRRTCDHRTMHTVCLFTKHTGHTGPSTIVI